MWPTEDAFRCHRIISVFATIQKECACNTASRAVVVRPRSQSRLVVDSLNRSIRSFARATSLRWFRCAVSTVVEFPSVRKLSTILDLVYNPLVIKVLWFVLNLFARMSRTVLFSTRWILINGNGIVIIFVKWKRNTLNNSVIVQFERKKHYI